MPSTVTQKLMDGHAVEETWSDRNTMCAILDSFAVRVRQGAFGRIAGQVKHVAGFDHRPGVNRQRFGQRPMNDLCLALWKILGELLVDARDIGGIQGKVLPTGAPDVLLVKNEKFSQRAAETTVIAPSQPFIGNGQAAEVAVPVEPM